MVFKGLIAKPTIDLFFNKGYTEAKSDFIDKWTKKARKEFGDRYKIDIE